MHYFCHFVTSPALFTDIKLFVNPSSATSSQMSGLFRDYRACNEVLLKHPGKLDTQKKRTAGEVRSILVVLSCLKPGQLHVASVPGMSTLLVRESWSIQPI